MGSEVSKTEIAKYYALRKFTKGIGMTDDVFPRAHISRNEPVENISRKKFDECYQAELDALELAIKYVEFDAIARTREEAGEVLRNAEAWRNEALRLRDEVKTYRLMLGLDKQ